MTNPMQTKAVDGGYAIFNGDNRWDDTVYEDYATAELLAIKLARLWLDGYGVGGEAAIDCMRSTMFAPGAA